MAGEDPQVDHRIIKIGERIGWLRKQAGLSLRALAHLTGVSFTTIQKIESNTIVPSVASVIKIAQGLGRSVSFFLEEGERAGDVQLVRRRERPVTEVPASGLRVEDVAMDLRDSFLQATLLKIAPGGVSGEEPLQHPGEEVKLCLQGKIEYRVGEETYTLGEGDCLHFKSDIPHFWRNTGKREAVILSVCTPPPFFTVSYLSAHAERGPDNGAAAGEDAARPTSRPSRRARAEKGASGNASARRSATHPHRPAGFSRGGGKV